MPAAVIAHVGPAHRIVGPITREAVGVAIGRSDVAGAVDRPVSTLSRKLSLHRSILRVLSILRETPVSSCLANGAEEQEVPQLGVGHAPTIILD